MLIACTVLVSALCCTKIKPPPPAATTFDTLLVQPASVLTLPISFDLAKIEAVIDEKLRGTFLKKRVATNTNDSLYFELTSLQPIVMSWRAPDLRSTAVLRVSGHYIKKVLGVKIRNKEPIDFELKIRLKTELGFKDDWSLRPRTEIELIEWKKDPELNLGVVVLNFRGIIEKALYDNEESLTRLLDGFLSREVDTRKVITNIWNNVQQPIRLKKEEPRIWLLVEADSLKARWTRGPERLISVQARVIGRVRTVLEGENLAVGAKALPPFSYRTGNTDSLFANVLCVLPFDLTSRYMKQALAGASLDSAGYKVEIKDVEVYGVKEGLVVKVTVGGDIHGDMYFRGNPVIDPVSKRCLVENFDFDVRTQDALLSTADWLLHSSLKRTIERHLVYDLAPYADMLPMLIKQGIEKGKLGERIDINIGSWEVTPLQTVITKKDIQMVVRVAGVAEMVLESIRKDTLSSPELAN